MNDLAKDIYARLVVELIEKTPDLQELRPSLKTIAALSLTAEEVFDLERHSRYPNSGNCY